MNTVPETSPAVKTRKSKPAYEAYRAHLFGDCDSCAVGRWCSTLDLLDYLAAQEVTEAHRGK